MPDRKSTALKVNVSPLSVAEEVTVHVPGTLVVGHVPPSLKTAAALLVLQASSVRLFDVEAGSFFKEPEYEYSVHVDSFASPSPTL